jgi:hypothetical protein
MAQAKTKINKELLTEWVINMRNSFADIDSHITEFGDDDEYTEYVYVDCSDMEKQLDNLYFFIQSL